MKGQWKDSTIKPTQVVMLKTIFPPWKIFDKFVFYTTKTLQIQILVLILKCSISDEYTDYYRKLNNLTW